MPIQLKKDGTYSSLVGISYKKNGVYAAVQGAYVKAGGAYQNVFSSSTARALVVDDDWEVDSDAITLFATMSGLLREKPEYNLVALVASSPVPTSAPAVRGMANYAGLNSVPVGAFKGANTEFTINRNISSPWNPIVQDATGQTGKTIDDLPDAVTMLRTVIAGLSRTDGIYTLTGGGAVLAALWRSPADGISPLTGKALFDSKFSEIYWLGGQYGNGFASSQSGDYNFGHAPADAAYINQNSIKPIRWVGGAVSSQMKCGPAISHDPNLDPYRAGMIAAQIAETNNQDANGKRVAYDPTLMSYALRAANGAFYTEERGTNTISGGAGDQSWVADPAGRDYSMKLAVSPATINTELDRLIGVAYTPASPSLTPNAGRLWVPADLPAANRLFHFDAQDASTIVQSGGVVTGWNDKFGLRSLSQATAARQPAYSADAGGTGIGGITFVDDRLDGAFTGLTSTDTFAIIFVLNDTGGNTNDSRLFSAATATTFDYQDAGMYLLLQANGRGAALRAGGRATGSSDIGTGIRTLALQTGAVSTLRNSGAVVANTSAGAFADSSTLARFSLGSTVQGTTEDFKGIIFEVIGIKNPTQDMIDRAAGYAMHRRSAQGNLHYQATYRPYPPRWTL